MTQVVVQLVPHPAKPGGEGSAFDTAKHFGSRLEAVHLLSDDAASAQWFSAQIEQAKAAEFVDSLRSLPDVSAAYVKPRAAAP
jgi:hypothetical protein